MAGRGATPRAGGLPTGDRVLIWLPVADDPGVRVRDGSGAGDEQADSLRADSLRAASLRPDRVRPDRVRPDRLRADRQPGEERAGDERASSKQASSKQASSKRASSNQAGDERAGAGVRSVHLALDVLEAIALSGDELGVTQIADHLAVTKGAVHRHLHTLVERGYLSRNPTTARYALGPKSRLLARFSPETDLVQAADGPMRELRDRLGHTAVLSAMTPRGALVLATVAGASTIEIGVRPGSELPFHASAQGKVLLAFAPPPVKERVLARPLEAFTARTMVDRARVEAELARIVRQGYATAPEEVVVGINVMAAPVFGARDGCVGALAVVGSIRVLPEEPNPETVTSLQGYAQKLSRRLALSRRVP